jgi:Mrp family chromosome partitioning ATPase
MSTNQAFIKAYRRDPPRSAVTSPTQAAPAPRVAPPAAAIVAAGANQWQSTIEIAAANFAWPATSVVAGPPPAPLELDSSATAPAAPAKRPLSSFTPAPHFDPAPLEEPTFLPETTISAFRWPPVCRALWERYANHYHHIAEILLGSAQREAGRGELVGVISLHAGDGATTTLLCLAIALAARKKSLILVDANFRAPRLAGLLGVQPSTSWQDVLGQGLSVADAVICAEDDHIDLLPLDVREPAAREPNGAKLAQSVQSTITADVLRYAYDMVLVDLGAVLAPRSFTTISQLIHNMRIEAAVAVTDPKHAEADDLAVAGELLDEAGCRLLGLIENRVPGGISSP